MNYEYKNDQGKLSIKAYYCESNDKETDTGDFELRITYELSETFDMFQTILTKDDILKNNKIFNFDYTIILDLIKKEPSDIKCDNGPGVNGAELKYIFKVLEKEYGVVFIIPPKERKEGEDEKYIVLEKKIKKLEKENKTFEKKINNLLKFVLITKPFNNNTKLLAMKEGNLEKLKIAKEIGLPFDTSVHGHFLLDACALGYYEMVKWACEEGFQLSPVLFDRIVYGGNQNEELRLKIIDCLIDHKCQFPTDFTNQIGHAIYTKNFEIVKLLKERKMPYDRDKVFSNMSRAKIPQEIADWAKLNL